MKKLFKTNLLVLAMIFAISTAFAFKAENNSRTNVKWANINGTYEDVNELEQSDDGETRDYKCTSDPMICTAEYPSGVHPNDLGATPSNIVRGIFSFE